MSTPYGPNFYHHWLEATSKDIVRRFPISAESALGLTVIKAVDASGIRTDSALLDVVILHTSNEPTEAETLKEFGPTAGWREARRCSGILAMQRDLREATEEEYEKRKADEAKLSPAARLLPLAVDHAALDHYVKGEYRAHDSAGSEFRGCSIGCTINDARSLGLLPADTAVDNHEAVGDLLFGGVENLARLQDRMFEGLHGKDSIQWTARLLRAVATIPSTLNWQRVWHLWAEGTMKDLAELDSVKNHPCVAAGVDWVREMHGRAAIGVAIDPADIQAAARCAQRNTSLDGTFPHDASKAAVTAARGANREIHNGNYVAYYAGLAGIPYPRMADRFIAEITSKA